MNDELKVVIIAGPAGVGRKIMTAKKNMPKDADLANVEKALKRAAKTARELARKTHTPCYVVEEGKIVNVAERQADYRPEKKKPTDGTGTPE